MRRRASPHAPEIQRNPSPDQGLGPAPPGLRGGVPRGGDRVPVYFVPRGRPRRFLRRDGAGRAPGEHRARGFQLRGDERQQPEDFPPPEGSAVRADTAAQTGPHRLGVVLGGWVGVLAGEGQNYQKVA